MQRDDFQSRMDPSQAEGALQLGMEERTDAYSTYNQINAILNQLKIILGYIRHNGDPKGVRPTSK